MKTYRLLYDSVIDFKRAAVLVEAEIGRYDIRYDSDDVVQGMTGRKHHDTWVSMKAVSHFNLGTALELMLKLLLVRSGGTAPNRHELAKLHDALLEKDRKELECKYRVSRRESSNFALLMFNNPGSKPPPDTRNINSLRGFLEYLERDVMVSKKRYSWEQARDGVWRYYLSDITVFVELIDRVMKDIPRDWPEVL